MTADDSARVTVGIVQSEIVIGMDAASVAEALGSPNIVTTDEKRREVWVYDKVSTDRVDSARSNHATLILIGVIATPLSGRGFCQFVILRSLRRRISPLELRQHA